MVITKDRCGNGELCFIGATLPQELTDEFCHNQVFKLNLRRMFKERLLYGVIVQERTNGEYDYVFS